jgi:hypothetical protein
MSARAGGGGDAMACRSSRWSGPPPGVKDLRLAGWWATRRTLRWWCGWCGRRSTASSVRCGAGAGGVASWKYGALWAVGPGGRPCRSPVDPFGRGRRCRGGVAGRGSGRSQAGGEERGDCPGPRGGWRQGSPSRSGERKAVFALECAYSASSSPPVGGDSGRQRDAARGGAGRRGPAVRLRGRSRSGSRRRRSRAAVVP